MSVAVGDGFAASIAAWAALFTLPADDGFECELKWLKLPLRECWGTGGFIDPVPPRLARRASRRLAAGLRAWEVRRGVGTLPVPGDIGVEPVLPMGVSGESLVCTGGVGGSPRFVGVVESEADGVGWLPVGEGTVPDSVREGYSTSCV